MVQSRQNCKVESIRQPVRLWIALGACSVVHVECTAYSHEELGHGLVATFSK